MVDSGEGLKPDQNLASEAQRPEQDKLNLYADILHKEATSLLSRYLPEALPLEPTEVFIGVVPNYLGKFKDKHCIALERDEDQDPAIQAVKEYSRDLEWIYEQLKLNDELETERTRLVEVKAEKGEFDFADIDAKIDHELELVKQRPKPEPEIETKDFEEPEKLLQGQSQYSIDSWTNVYMLVHELIHQKQAELNPSAFFVLTSPELDRIDPDTIARDKLYGLLIESHRAQARTQSKDSLFDSVIEGMAVLGSFYVMGRLADDLAKSGEKDVADKVREVRKTRIHDEVINSKRMARTGEDGNYSLNYAKGIGMMRKLYKQFGLENAPKMLAAVDLIACRQITKDSPQYQQIMENPALLPGLPQAA